MQYFGFNPSAINNLTNSKVQFVSLHSLDQDNEADDYEGERNLREMPPFQMSDDEILSLLGRNLIPDSHVVMKGFKLPGKFYIYNTILNAFKGKDGKFYPVPNFSTECEFSSLKEAYQSVGEVDRTLINSYRVYEKIDISFLNESKFEASFLEKEEGEKEAIQYGEEHSLYKLMGIISNLISEEYIPEYSLSELLEDLDYCSIKEKTNDELFLINKNEADRIYQHLLDVVLIQPNTKNRPRLLREYLGEN